MSFRSIDHSSPVTVTLSPEQTKELLTLSVPTGEGPRYDDSGLRATIAYLQAEISLMQEALKECKNEVKEKSKPESPDYAWLSRDLSDFKEILKTLGYNREILADLWGESFLKALSTVIPPQKDTIDVVFPQGYPTDLVLRIAAIFSSFGLVTISILLMLQYIYN